MTYSLDHIVIVVEDLERAQADYRELGFTVVDGGQHADGLSHNALVAFQDGSYLELLAFIGPPSTGHPFYREHGEEGLVTFALLPEQIEQDVSDARERGLPMDNPKRGGRNRPDGVSIEWQTAWPETHDLPFLCADVTPRELRVPYGPAQLHSNGITGIAAIIVLVNNLDQSSKRYTALLGLDPLPHGPYHNLQSVSFAVSATVITLIHPDSGPMKSHLDRRGDGPFALSLEAGEGRQISDMETSLTHGVELEVVPQGSDLLGTLL